MGIVLITIFSIILIVLSIYVSYLGYKEREEYIESIRKTEGEEKARQKRYELEQQDRMRNAIMWHNNNHYGNWRF